jgi:hypothetical protein
MRWRSGVLGSLQSRGEILSSARICSRRQANEQAMQALEESRAQFALSAEAYYPRAFGFYLPSP